VLDAVTDDDRPASARRLREARINAGFKTVKDFARYIGVNYTTYYRHESGGVAINAENARFYADKLKVSPTEILYGNHLQLPTEVPIVGVIGAGGIIRMTTAGLQAKTSPGRHRALCGLLVEGDDLYPAVRNGDKVYFAPLDPASFVLNDVQGEECVCQLQDGTMMLRVVTMQPDGLATLIAYTGRPLFNVDLAAASPVELVERAARIKPRPV
jgi:hypothetical protein